MAHFGGLDDDEDDHDEDAFGGDDEGGHEDGHRQQVCLQINEVESVLGGSLELVRRADVTVRIMLLDSFHPRP